MTPKKALAAYLLTIGVFLLGLCSLYNNIKPQLEEAEKAIEEGTTIVLKMGIKKDQLSSLLYDGGYILNRKDADFISDRIKKYLDVKGTFENLGTLLTDELKVTADTALMYGGEGFKSRVETDLYNLGVTKDVEEAPIKNTFEEDNADGLIRVQVINGKQVSDTLSGIAVRIKHYTYKKTYRYSYRKIDGRNVKIDSSLVDSVLVDSILGYARTDTNGVATFKVKKGEHYSVLPIRKGFQYGREKGTTNGALLDDLDITFVQKPHVISLFPRQAFLNLKYDRTLIVRTPAEFKDSLIRMAVAFIFGWFIFLLFTFKLDKKLNTRSDYLLIIALMAITGIGFLASYGIWNPLTDKLYGSTMTEAFIYGLVGMTIITLIDYAGLDNRLTKSKWWLFRNYGWGAFIMAGGLLCLLYLFGSGPDGSDAKVNLLGFQPSEIVRVLIIIFIAWFFTRKATLIQDFSQMLTRQTAKRQVETVLWIISGVIALMAIYLVLSDIGPALVVLISFILIYSMARRDFAQLLVGLLTFIVFMLCARWLNNSLPTLLISAAIWFILWIGYWYWKKRQIYESAIFLNLVIVVFSTAGLILEAVGQYGLAARLTNRTDMSWDGVWNNEVLGGDQVAQGIWSLATGGLTGLGLGNGSPSIVPAGHTDMIFTTIGEMLGFVGLILIVLCLFIIIHRTLLIGRRAGHPFPFYLATGLGIVTGIQFLIIVAGSIGLLPLTGVTLPFLSYGGTSLVVTLASFGFIISISRLRAEGIQKKYNNSFNGSMVACSGLFLLIGVALLGATAYYQIFSRGETLIRPAYVTNMDGARIIEYNPRINLVLRKIEAGNIYDRKGVLLATSSREELENSKASLLDVGVTTTMYNNEYNKRKYRYYPFGNHTLFMLGDYNTRKVFNYYDNNPTGYLAEARHLHELRGINIPSEKVSLMAHYYKENRFVDAVKKEFPAREYDYSNLLKEGFLDYGIERNPIIDKHNERRKKRDMVLTLDAGLQMRLQNAMNDAISKNPLFKNKKLLRASVVVLDAKHGDLICSANYPLPNQDTIFMLNERRIYGDIPFEKIVGHVPITERDLGLTFQTQPGSTAKIMSAMAGFMRFGDDAAKIRYNINEKECIEPPNVEPHGLVSMRNAIVNSSNCYFINLVHDKNLYPELDSIYYNVGVRVNPDSIYAKGNIVPYYFSLEEFTQRKEFSTLLANLGIKANTKYNNYIQERRQGKFRKMNFGEMQAAWGQGPILASPLNMARIASIVANNGEFVPTRYVLGDKDFPEESAIRIISEKSAKKLKSYMQQESDKHRNNFVALPLSATNSIRMGGKTGTPERTLPQRFWTKDENSMVSNDAWYIFFIESENLKAPLAIAVRFERTKGIIAGKAIGSQFGSRSAVQFVADVIIPTLNNAGYKVK